MNSAGWRNVRRWVGALALGLSLIGGMSPASAAGKTTTPQEKARFVAITRSLEDAPLKPDARADRQWALAWITEAPDVSVNICASVLKDVLDSKNPYGPELVGQYLFGASAIEHPDSTDEAQQLAGMESVIKTYRSIVRDKPGAASADLDALVKVQADGALPAFVHKGYEACATKT